MLKEYGVNMQEELKKSNVTLQTKNDNLLLQNENLKCTIKTLLLDSKLSKLENRIVKGLTNPSGDTPDVATKQSTSTMIKKHNSTASARPFSPVKSFYDECTDLQIKQCTEWWCPMHSNFAVLVKEVKPSTYEDETLIKRAKSRFAYWAKGDTENERSAPALVAGMVTINDANFVTCGRLSDKPVDLRYNQSS
ncbi:hypothetical protein AGLY_016618 [Aphis glycines]|uniref:Uncharacterized protein n=1 Tax=Aphis glycines TaxID=307491 RepID=A0A6G0SZA5_APHGL|nr:hypothetical protein AGLY_016618 [Aphis glycines]